MLLLMYTWACESTSLVKLNAHCCRALLRVSKTWGCSNGCSLAQVNLISVVLIGSLDDVSHMCTVFVLNTCQHITKISTYYARPSLIPISHIYCTPTDAWVTICHVYTLQLNCKGLVLEYGCDALGTIMFQAIVLVSFFIFTWSNG